ncbi:MAG: OmpA family protein [Deltaproteobacteria bacterium]|nr:OmpA family protein [Deltaproteobacteria bacterium]
MRSNKLLVSCLLLAVTACKSKVDSEPVARTPAAEAPAATTGFANKPTPADPELAVITVTTVDIDTKLAVMCGISDTKVFFKFDSAAMRPEAKELIGKIASCALEGPAKGKALRVVGRTDPRGSDQYNKELGLDRARAVAESLESHGVSETRVETLSRGEAAADPAEPEGWPNDRRVTVRLDG